jgi:hypothetical protein
LLKKPQSNKGRSMIAHRRIATALCIVGLCAAAQPRIASAADCAKLAELALPNTTITLAENTAAGALKLPPGASPPGFPAAAFGNLPAFCRVAGTIKPTSDSDIRFEVWMPADWNGKFVGVGNGVWAGSISYFEMIAPLTRGYATAATDDGHQGNPLDASFAVGHPEKLVDFGHRAPHEMTVAAKTTISAFYGKAPSRSLFASCSTGGRQGLMEAYRYPQDYDGIASMAPANPMVPLMVGSLWTGYVTMKDAASKIPPPKFMAVHKAAVAACDANDGVKDGIISSPERCKFDPAVLQCKGDDAADCLTAAQLSALRGIYDGAKNPRTGKPIYPGFAVGSETMFPALTSGTEPFPVATTYLRGLVFNDPKWDFKSFDYDKDVTRALQAHSAILDVPPTGLDSFFSDGRKLLLSHGWADGLIPAQSTVEFYSALTRHIGKKKADQGTRLFMVPGMGHCSGGEGPFVIDAIGTIDRWVETGRAPERLVASNPPNATARTRPLCPYPQEATYSGSGSTDEEKNFKCAAPAR